MLKQDPSFASLTQDDSTALLREIAAAPRPTGSAAIGAARARCARELRDLGFEVKDRPFEFSAFPGRFATPLLGGAAAMTVGIAGQWGANGQRISPLVALALGAIALLLMGRWLATRGVLATPVLRQRGVNLQAVRPGETPLVWLSAHLDTKSQPVPTLVRSVAIVLESVGYLATLGLAIAAAVGADPGAFYWTFAAFVTLIGAIPVILSVVGSRSPGALDNASGVATVIAAARSLPDKSGIGVLLTDGEELGLAGARAWTPEQDVAAVLNCDGVDDSGRVAVMFSGRRPASVVDAVARASRTTGVTYEAMRLIPGILTDSVAFSDAGFDSVTFSRGTVASLGRVHSRRDDLAHLRGTGIAEAAMLMGATAREILAQRRRETR